ncbi:MAG: pitrilysin family protein [Muribaculaceae bacterium]|nr:pitrilysin family protein [Muribaculaceae bacterium]
MNIERHTLPNGLRIVHHHDPDTAMVAVNMLYDVGARDEDPGCTGIAHLFEHLMFGGSVNVKDFDAELQRAGGQSNAWTGNDFTNFYEILPAHNIETALWLESDRMLQPALGDQALEEQRSVVLEEFKQTCTNAPYGSLMHHLRKLIYTRHPYRWPVIGVTPDHIKNVTRQQVQQFFNSHYAPGRAILSVSGNINSDKLFRLAEKWFGDIENRPTAPRVLPAEPVQTEPRMAVVEKGVPSTCVSVCYNMSRYGTDEYIAADLITDILSAGKSSRFYRRLFLTTPYFSEIDASIIGCEDPGVVMIMAFLNPGVDPRQAIDAIEKELRQLVEQGATEHELQRAKNKSQSTRTFGMMNVGTRASEIALAEYHGETIAEISARYRNLPLATVNRVAAELFRPENQNILIYK